MTEKKAAAAPRKTAEAKPEPKQKADVPVYAFPLPRSHYFSTAATSHRSTSSGPGVASIQRAMGVKQSGTYDTNLRVKVMEWQDEHDRPVTGVVDSGDWDVMFNEV